MRSKIITIVVAISFMFLGILIGIFRLFTINNLYPKATIFELMYNLHGYIMIYGFISTLIMLERYFGASSAILKRFKLINLMLPSFILGFVIYLSGWLTYLKTILQIGAGMMILGVGIFIILMWQMSSMGKSKVPLGFMLLGCLALVSSIIIPSYTMLYNWLGVTLLMLSFPMLFIFGERVELITLGFTRIDIRLFRHALMISSFSLLSLIFGTVIYYIKFLVIISAIGYFITALFIYIAEGPSIKYMLIKGLKLQRYISLHLGLAYLWVLAGIIIFIISFINPANPYLYDAYLHSIGVGFIGTMILGHGPIILPTLFNKIIDAKRLTIAPLLILTLANFIRILGDMLIQTISSVNYLIGYSGLLVLISILTFILMIRRIIK